jgi:hypothetical protein
MRLLQFHAFAAAFALAPLAPGQWVEDVPDGPVVDGARADAPDAPPLAAARMPGERLFPDIPADVLDIGPHVLLEMIFREQLQPRDDNPQRVGLVLPLPEGILARPDWRATPEGGLVWAVELHAAAAGATAMRVQLRGWFAEDDLELRVYEPDRGLAFGPYSAPRLDENGEWWTTIIFGEAIGLEFHVPAGWGAAEDGGVGVEPRVPQAVAVAVHTAELGGLAAGLECSHNDVTCSPEWELHAAAVCRYSFISGGESFVCTGALLNRNPSDFSPLLLTADHCISTQAEANSVSAVWFFQTDACNGAPPDLNDLPRSDGTLLLKRRANSDMSFLGLLEPPAGTTWLGWNAGGWTLQSDAVGIHHPAGTFQRISEGDVTVALYVVYGQNNAHVWRVHWDSGSTEGGSSGSPVLDTSGNVRGQLKGGPNCGTGDYGRFGVSYNTLQPFISNMASPIHVNGVYGGTEHGTNSQPFRSVHRASYCVVAGDEIRVVPGNYNEQMTIWRPMTITRSGASGIVRIGAP